MTTTNLILVTGATGKTGRRVSALLRGRGFAVRDAARGTEVPFDWEDDQTWGPALEGATAIYIVPPFGLDPQTLRAFADAAVGAGARRATLVSSADLGDGPSPAEEQVRAAGLELTALRLRWYFQNFSEDFLRAPIVFGQIMLPAGQGREAFVDADDIAEVAAATLTDAAHAGRAYDLTGPRTMSFADVASEVSRATGRQVTYIPLTREEFIAAEIRAGSSPELAAGTADLYSDIASGNLDTVSGDVETVLGKPARDFSTYAQTCAATGVWDNR